MKTLDDTAATEEVELWDTEKVLVSEHNTRQPKPKDVTELVETIRAAGQITPAIARPHPTKPGCLELAAGARRRTACQVLGIRLKVVVRQISDQDLLDMILADNLQREDPDPEQEALLVEKRIAEGASPGEIAARYGKPDSWVLRRMKLIAIVPELRKLPKPGADMAHFTVEMRERMGALPPEKQKEIAKHRWPLAHARDLPSLREQLNRATADLKGCNWLDDPDTFVKGCGPGCAQSSDTGLFPEEGKCARCENPSCFFARRAKAIDKQIAAVLGDLKIEDVVAYSTEWNGECAYKGKKLQMVCGWSFKDHYSVAKKETKLRGLDLTHPDKPKLTWLEKVGRGVSGGKSTPGKKEPRENPVIGKRLAIINGILKKKLEDAPLPAQPSILVLTAAFGTRSCRADGVHHSFSAVPWDTIDDGKQGRPLSSGYNPGKEKPVSIELVLWQSVREVLTSRLFFQKNGDLLRKEKQEEMRRTAKLIGVDFDAEYARIATTEVKPPKSWGPDIDPVTLKPISAKEKLALAAGKAKPAGSSVPPAAKKAAKKAVKKVASKAAKKASKKASKPTGK